MPYRMEYGMYRVQVDLMGHHLLGRKNLFYLMDALWATDYELHVPLKWMMPPFGNDWMSSLFASFDPVAIESVGYDFLRAEFTAARRAGTYPQMPATDDYLHQAADSSNWPWGIRYDPEDDGTVLASLGTHEHWNDSLHKQYSRNLGTGDGIELVGPGAVTSVRGDPPAVAARAILHQNYPNPFNPSTTIRYELPEASTVRLSVFDVLGHEVSVLVNERREAGAHEVSFDAAGLPSGIYFCRFGAGAVTHVKRFLLVR